jgi:hypothetical protein
VSPKVVGQLLAVVLQLWETPVKQAGLDLQREIVIMEARYGQERIK